ncbi:SDR family NAD(P)-dependent oxidoreductase [Agrobacterium sp. CMT1]|jgi:NAD(P)-dependent dehydrogenase (short-subunit alcohol dehydrogenase family)|uniref:SDR family NAD(P)-dependent oxidoreductase n=1 Tax=Agrobacterium TaxID=357 RepID=UPI0013AF77F7|nr:MULTISPECIES: SDR family NAD(P)-dependent oxidoreductase [Agrobacterium]MBB2907025.1 NAD(P)-dependent dehydrogenase (short-subunit alcohol dehydrogenase family) [Rhizobium sp. RAS22]MBM7325988.1 SDR family NAD(P)-dependent oxidoreductase [Agrobacterium sp. S2]MBW9059430.1 SDR family NAD(P)-dependent oxidoreductase [Agrobacterium pusense]MCW8279700.1 SDR family NAD(P)-dependent oxidoreductase [Agrobacterium sp. InxBP2]NTE48502.1 SDR family NAD(P)-dependent oxidoreductase [Agrobacterium pusen
MLHSLANGYRAIVIGASGGIGGALLSLLQTDPRCALALPLSRSGGDLDITDEASVAGAVSRLSDQRGSFDLVFNATGALTIDGVGPEKTIKAIDPSQMAKQFAVNSIGPALLLKHFAPLLKREERCVFASLSARVGSIGDNRLGGWISYRASKAAQNQIIRTAAIEIARTHPQSIVVALHPGTVDTDLSQAFSKGRERFSPKHAAASLLATIDGLTPAQTGQFFAYDGRRIEW